MKPLPFPLALNIGTDIVHLPRITRLITRPTYLTRFTRIILSEPEQHDFHTRFSLPSLPLPVLNSSKSGPASIQISADMTRWLAGRFAAKEAARKAAPRGAGSLGWKDVVVRVGEGDRDGDAKGRPEVVYFDRSGDSREEGEWQGRVGRLSISHDGEYVVATVLAAG
ncbi:4'-phosphopantetheinyl transferase superfamily [Aspergillus cavernicola]|uniref:4'-phosphopantetheinyl transferase superfamily n=1 Tax=Aspergillus cavernicola TaxID=176166 RepID=A0ABR4IXE4_9EURO